VDINTLCARYKNQLLALTKCLESNSTVHNNYDKFVFNICGGDVLFQATDGVYHFLKLSDVTETIKNNRNNFDAISRNLIHIALDNKSNDNLTCVVVEPLNANSDD
jgi:serine/threonine protein phosphatase PrpC